MRHGPQLTPELERLGSLVKRTVTAPFRALPGFLVLGAQKAGTTSLFTHLSKHPDVIPPLRKEIHYFDLAFPKPLLWYRAHFPTRSNLARTDGRLTGEASPDYLYHPMAAERIRESLPNPKLIVLLRDPVERAFSHYHHERERNREPLPTFELAVHAERDRLELGASSEGHETDRYTTEHRRHSYLARGRYAEQLRRYYDRFPSDDILVLFSEEMFEDTQRTVDRVLDFLELRSMDLRRPKSENVGTYDKQRSIPMEAELRRVFEGPNRRLREMLGTPLPWPSAASGTNAPVESRDPQVRVVPEGGPAFPNATV